MNLCQNLLHSTSLEEEIPRENQEVKGHESGSGKKSCNHTQCTNASTACVHFTHTHTLSLHIVSRIADSALFPRGQIKPQR